MPRPKKYDSDILQAALVGFGHALGTIERRIADLRARIAGQPTPADAADSPEPAKKRTMSPAARKRIALAQKKRWAQVNASKTKSPAKPPKRALSAEGRARIIAATKKRWEAFHKKEQAPKPAAKKAPKPVAKKAAPPSAPPVPATSAPTPAAE